MFNIFKKKVPEGSIMAPVSGKSVALKDVPDEVFASGVMGQGVGIKIADDTIKSPVAGKITAIPGSKHAFGVTANDGAEVLVHIGIDTVNLKGKGFTALAKVGDKVNVGDPVIKVDRNEIEAAGYNLVTMVIITNGDEFDVVVDPIGDVVEGKTEVIKVTKK